MRVVLLTSDCNIPANIALREFIEHPQRLKHDIQIVGILYTGTLSPWRRQFWSQAWRLIDRLGIILTIKTSFMAIVPQWIIGWQRLWKPRQKRAVLSFRELGEIAQSPVLQIDKVNSDDSLKWIKSRKPDYLVSCLLLQKVSSAVLKIPKKGAINFHPALFRDHRGSWSSFWALFNNFRSWGATVHHMTPELDAGEVIVQKRFGIRSSDSMNSLSRRSSVAGGRLLIKALIRLQKKHQAVRVRRSPLLWGAPTAKHIKKFLRKGRVLFRWRDLWSPLRSPQK